MEVEKLAHRRGYCLDPDDFHPSLSRTDLPLFRGGDWVFKGLIRCKWFMIPFVQNEVLIVFGVC